MENLSSRVSCKKFLSGYTNSILYDNYCICISKMFGQKRFENLSLNLNDPTVNVIIAISIIKDDQKWFGLKTVPI